MSPVPERSKATKVIVPVVDVAVDLSNARFPKLQRDGAGISFDPIRAIYGISRDELLKKNVSFLVDGWTKSVYKNGFCSENLKLFADFKVSGLSNQPRKLKVDAGRSSVGVFAIFDSLKLFSSDPKSEEIVNQARISFGKGPHKVIFEATIEDFNAFLRQHSH